MENPILAKYNIRVLPIGRQTNKVEGSESDGRSDGLANGTDLIQTFGEDYLVANGARFFVFLVNLGANQQSDEIGILLY